MGFPLDSHIDYDGDGNPSFDRAITSAPLRKLLKGIITDGVSPDASRILADVTDGSMQVTAGEGMTVIVNKGLAICNGCIKLEENNRTLTVQASTTQDRIDTVVLRLNDNDNVRSCDFYILQGTPASSPIRPELTRNESVWEIGLADLFISANSTAISSARITDTRLETDRCGVMSSISEFDTTSLYNQIQQNLLEFKTVNEAEFAEWFATIQDILDEETAGHLQNEIYALQNDLEELTEAVAGIPADIGNMADLPNPTETIVGNINGLNTNLTNLTNLITVKTYTNVPLNITTGIVGGTAYYGDINIVSDKEQYGEPFSICAKDNISVPCVCCFVSSSSAFYARCIKISSNGSGTANVTIAYLKQIH